MRFFKKLKPSHLSKFVSQHPGHTNLINGSWRDSEIIAASDLGIAVCQKKAAKVAQVFGEKIPQFGGGSPFNNSSLPSLPKLGWPRFRTHGTTFGATGTHHSAFSEFMTAWWQLKDLVHFQPRRLGEDEPILRIIFFGDGLKPTTRGRFDGFWRRPVFFFI